MSFKFRIKPPLQQLFNHLQYGLARFSSWLDRKHLPNPNDFDDLSPIDNVPNAETYNQVIEWVLANKRDWSLWIGEKQFAENV